MPGAIVLVRLAQVDADEIEPAMTHTAFGDDLLGELPHSFCRAFEGSNLEALFVVEVHMHGSDREIVVFMQQARQALGQLSFMMVIDVGQTRDAQTVAVVSLVAPLQQIAQDVAHRLAARGVSALFDERIECRSQLLAERNREAIHSFPVGARRSGAALESFDLLAQRSDLAFERGQAIGVRVGDVRVSGVRWR